MGPHHLEIRTCRLLLEAIAYMSFNGREVTAPMYSHMAPTFLLCVDGKSGLAVIFYLTVYLAYSITAIILREDKDEPGSCIYASPESGDPYMQIAHAAPYPASQSRIHQELCIRSQRYYTLILNYLYKYTK